MRDGRAELAHGGSFPYCPLVGAGLLASSPLLPSATPTNASFDGHISTFLSTFLQLQVVSERFLDSVGGDSRKFQRQSVLLFLSRQVPRSWGSFRTATPSILTSPPTRNCPFWNMVGNGQPESLISFAGFALNIVLVTSYFWEYFIYLVGI